MRKTQRALSLLPCARPAAPAARLSPLPAGQKGCAWLSLQTTEGLPLPYPMGHQGRCPPAAGTEMGESKRGCTACPHPRSYTCTRSARGAGQSLLALYHAGSLLRGWECEVGELQGQISPSSPPPLTGIHWTCQ